MRGIVLCALPLALAATSALAAARVKITRVELLDWNTRNSPCPPMKARLAAGQPNQRWGQVVASYQCDQDGLDGLRVEFLLFVRGARCGRVVLAGSQIAGDSHRPHAYRARMFLAPRLLESLGPHTIEAAVVEVWRDETRLARYAPPRLDAAGWKDCPVLGGLLLDRLETPWADLDVSRFGELGNSRAALGPAPSPSAKDRPAQGPPADFLARFAKMPAGEVPLE